MREVVLDADGLPRIEAARDEEGHLRFYCAHRYSGGRMVLDPVPDAVVRDVPRPAEDALAVRELLRAVALGVARSIAAGDTAREAQVEALEAQLSDAGDELEDARRQAAEAEAARDEAIAERDRLAAELARAGTHGGKPPASGKASRSRAVAAA